MIFSLIIKQFIDIDRPESYIESNPLLASWGRLGRDYISILYGHDDVKEMQVNLYEDALLENEEKQEGKLNALAYLQSDILNLQAIPRKIEQTDKSIRFISCHSHLREVEALHDYLFSLLDESSDLSPKDVIVMMPDVQEQLPQPLQIGAPQGAPQPQPQGGINAQIAEQVV